MYVPGAAARRRRGGRRGDARRAQTDLPRRDAVPWQRPRPGRGSGARPPATSDGRRRRRLRERSLPARGDGTRQERRRTDRRRRGRPQRRCRARRQLGVFADLRDPHRRRPPLPRRLSRGRGRRPASCGPPVPVFPPSCVSGRGAPPLAFVFVRRLGGSSGDPKRAVQVTPLPTRPGRHLPQRGFVSTSSKRTCVCGRIFRRTPRRRGGSVRRLRWLSTADDRDPTFLPRSTFLAVTRSLARFLYLAQTDPGRSSCRSVCAAVRPQHGPQTAGGVCLRARRGGDAGRHPRRHPRVRQSGPRRSVFRQPQFGRGGV